MEFFLSDSQQAFLRCVFSYDDTQSSHENKCAAKVRHLDEAAVFGNKNAVDRWADEYLVTC